MFTIFLGIFAKNDSDIDRLYKDVWKFIQNIENLGPVKAHHVLQIGALIGMIPAKMFTWGDVLEKSCKISPLVKLVYTLIFSTKNFVNTMARE